MLYIYANLVAINATKKQDYITMHKDVYFSFLFLVSALIEQKEKKGGEAGGGGGLEFWMNLEGGA